MSTERFGSYQVIKRIAVGGMGEIFLARQVGLHGFERVAIIKTVLEDVMEQADRREMFLAEARVAALLNHPNIVQVYELGEQDGVLFMAMEYVEGETVGRVMQEARNLDRHFRWPFVDVVAQAARALHYAHQLHDSQGRALQVVHRDISPQNVMVRLDGVAKVVDFGIAKVAGASLRTRTGMFKGKPAYMAPEQVRRMAVDGRADVFALGVVLWELTVGQRMFPDLGDYDILGLIAEPRPRPSTVAADYPAELEAVVMKATALDPDERWQSARDLADALDGLLRDVPVEQNPNLGTYVEELVGLRVRALHGSGRGEGPRREDETLVPTASGSEAPTTPGAGRQKEERTTVSGRLKPIPSTPADTAAPTPPASEPITTSSTAGRTPRRWPWVWVSVPAACAAGVGIYLATVSPPSVENPPAPTTPAVTPPSAAVAPTTPSAPAGHPTVLPEADAATVVTLAEAAPDAAVPASPVAPVASARAGGRDARKPRSNEGPAPTTPAPVAPAPVAASPAPAAPTQARTGYLTVASSPWAIVTMDGTRTLGSTPVYAVEVPAGEHQLTLVNEAKALKKVVPVTVIAGKVVKLRVELDR
ncbi:MAG: protein kinase [Myxococcota bacterium]